MKRLVAAMAFSMVAGAAQAGGSNYGVRPGHLAEFRGKVTEWTVPTPQFARDPAPGPDGNIYIAVMQGNRIARFDVASRTFKEWDLPAGAHPHGLLVDRSGIVWYTGNGNGTIGRLDPATGRTVEYPVPAGRGAGPHTLVTDDAGTIWFTEQRANRIGRLDSASGRVTEYPTSGGPYGLALDRAGRVWFCRMGDDKVGVLDPASGRMGEIALPAGSMPRRMAAAPDGSIWVTLYGSGRLVRIDPETQRVSAEFALPGGAASGPYAVTVDGAGIVYANEFATDTLVRLDPTTGRMQPIRLPARSEGVRKMIVDAQGRLWYMGSHNGRVGMVE